MRSWILAARQSFWFLPAVFGVVSLVLAQGLVTVDRVFAVQIAGIPFFDELSASGGRSILTTIGTSILTVAGTSFSITISVLATTSSTYGPRLVRNFLADRANQFVLAMFTSTFLYCLIVVRAVRTTIEDRVSFVPTLSIHFAVLVAVVDVGVLVFFIHHIASSVQITTLQKRVQLDLMRAVDRTHPEATDDGWTREPTRLTGPTAAVLTEKDGYVQAVDIDDLRAIAIRHDLVLQMVAMPGDHLIEGAPLVVAAGSEPTGGVRMTDGTADDIRDAYAIGIARTPDQDVRFALQQLIEVAVRGLASGTNDPYTTISALELARVPLVPLMRRDEGPTGRLDDDGGLRVAFRWPAAGALVADVLDSVRQYGLEHPAVVRAALDLADDLGHASDDEGRRQTLASKVQELLTAYEATEPDAPDLDALSARGDEVLRRLRAPRADADGTAGVLTASS